MFAVVRCCLPNIWGMVGSMEATPDWERLARFARAARGPRTQSEIRNLGGPTDTTQSKIERNEWRPKRGVTDTLEKIDKGYGWRPGSAADVLAGGNPTIDDSEPPEEPGPLEAALAAVPTDSAQEAAMRARSIWPIGKMLFAVIDSWPSATKAHLASALGNVSIDLAEMLLPQVDSSPDLMAAYANATIAVRKFVELHDLYAPENKRAGSLFYHGIREMQQGVIGAAVDQGYHPQPPGLDSPARSDIAYPVPGVPSTDCDLDPPTRTDEVADGMSDEQPRGGRPAPAEEKAVGARRAAKAILGGPPVRTPESEDAPR